MTSLPRSFCALLLATAGVCHSAIELPEFFSDGMVLQREGDARVWGWLEEKGEVTVTFGERKETAKTDASGRWEVNFEGLQASVQGRELSITDGTETKTLEDVVVGEVWIASGQSNMEWVITKTENAEAVIAASEDPLLRVYVSRNVSTAEPQTDFPGRWLEASPETTGKMTAVGYYFAKNLREELGVPVGVIECAWGGKPAEAFISEGALKKLPEAKGLLQKKAQAIANWDEEKMQDRYQKILEKWGNEGKKRARPRMQDHPSVSSRLAGNIFHGMIAPLVGYGAQGVIWYQGESNARGGTADIYEELLACLVSDWRERWDSDLAFYYVQLANFEKPSTEPGIEDDWALTQDEMRRALDRIEHSGMAVINEIGAADNIHPTNKKDVGARLARWALGQDYGREEVVMSGPLFRSAEEKKGRMILSFEFDEGLTSRDGGPLKRFEIRAEEGDWVWAEAKIENGQVIVWSDQVDQPAAVRYAWASNPEGANLVNGEGLPASCFTTEESSVGR
ncbi:MAG: sialate O-acetylesterase [Verrucomicrobiales bacterium]